MHRVNDRNLLFSARIANPAKLLFIIDEPHLLRSQATDSAVIQRDDYSKNYLIQIRLLKDEGFVNMKFSKIVRVRGQIFILDKNE